MGAGDNNRTGCRVIKHTPSTQRKHPHPPEAVVTDVSAVPVVGLAAEVQAVSGISSCRIELMKVVGDRGVSTGKASTSRAGHTSAPGLSGSSFTLTGWISLQQATSHQSSSGCRDCSPGSWFSPCMCHIGHHLLLDGRVHLSDVRDDWSRRRGVRREQSRLEMRGAKTQSATNTDRSTVRHMTAYLQRERTTVLGHRVCGAGVVQHQRTVKTGNLTLWGVRQRVLQRVW